MGNQSVGIFRMGEEPVIACFIFHINAYQHKTGEAYGQAGHIDEAVERIPGEVTDGDFQVVSKHGLGFKVAFKKFEDAFVLICPATGLNEAVVFHRIYGKLPIVLAQFHQPLRQPHHVLEVNVGIHHSMAHQQGAFQPFGMVDGRAFGIGQAIGIGHVEDVGGITWL